MVAVFMLLASDHGHVTKISILEKRTKLKKICWKSGQNEGIFHCIIGQKAAYYK